MKSYIKYLLPALSVMALLSGCDENDWNDHLDGFEKPGISTGEKSQTYTLTAADYNTIATGSAYKAIAQEKGQADELALVATNLSFPSDEFARPYIEAFLASTSNNFFVLDNGSAVKVTYNVDTNIPEQVQAINAGVRQYNVSEDDYIDAWGSDDNYIAAYAPATPASRFIPALLKGNYPGAVAGDYAVVSYAEANENPVFGGVTPPEEWTATDVLGSAAEGDNVTVKGYITAIDNRGFILTDNGGSILVYQASGFDVNSVAIGNQITLTGDIGSYGKGLQIATDGTNYSIDGTGAYTYPSPKVYTGAMMDQAVGRTTNEYAEYVQITGKASVNGNYYNFTVDGAEASQGSGYQVPQAIKDQIKDGETYTIIGYFASISSGKYFNIVITEVLPAASGVAPRSRAAAVDPVTVNKAAIYRFNGTAWEVPASTVVLQPADYTAMGQSYGNLSGTLPATLLPIYLTRTYPYAQADDAITVAYKYYGDGTTSYRAAEYVYNGSEWSRNTGESTSQFVKQNNQWVYNPSVAITLPYARNTDPSYTYYMACVEWVFENISKPMGGTSIKAPSAAEASPFIDYRGNAEFYSGASAYYGNVDVRAATALTNAPAGYTGYDGLTDDEISMLLKKRFCTEVMPGALARLHPDAKAIDGMEVTYTINFTAYETGGVAVERTAVFTVSGPGTFKYKSCTWFTDGEDTDW